MASLEDEVLILLRLLIISVSSIGLFSGLQYGKSREQQVNCRCEK